MTSAVESDREQARDAYEAVLRVVDFQSTSKQPPGVRVSTVVRLLSNRFDRGAVERALETARGNDDLEAWPDQRGRKRYTHSEPDAVRRIAAWEAESGEPRKPVVGWANQRSDELAQEASDV